MAVRREKRRTPPRRRGPGLARFLARLVEVSVCLAIIGGACYGFYSFASESPYFRVKWIQVEGAEVLTEDAVIAATGLTSASNILAVRPAAIEARVRALPYVDECQVTTVFPDTVNVEITERTAYATVLVQNRLFTIDREGRVLSELAPGERGVGPLITSLPGPPTAEPGHSLDCAPLREALAVWEAFSSSDVATVLQLSELAAIHENDIRMYCENLPYEIRWGRGVYAEQADRLDALWRAKGGRLPCSQYLDLRFGRDLVCK